MERRREGFCRSCSITRGSRQQREGLGGEGVSFFFFFFFLLRDPQLALCQALAIWILVQTGVLVFFTSLYPSAKGQVQMLETVRSLVPGCRRESESPQPCLQRKTWILLGKGTREGLKRGGP